MHDDISCYNVWLKRWLQISNPSLKGFLISEGNFDVKFVRVSVRKGGEFDS